MALNNSNIATGAINLLAMLLAGPIIFAGIWLSNKLDNSCLRLIPQWPIIALGISVLVVGVAGFIGGFWRMKWLLVLYFIFMFVLIMVLASLVGFIYKFMVATGGSGHAAPGRTFLEYELNEFSGWLTRRIEDPQEWDRIRNCLSSTSVCSELNQAYRLPQDFFNAYISPLQSGCCKPPTQCNYTFVNPSYWIFPMNKGADMDCLIWSNFQSQLCYACDSCKAGLLANLKQEWRKADIFLSITLVALSFVYLIGCCCACLAFRNAKAQSSSSASTAPRKAARRRNS
ncbi:protein TORNADO 2-like [Malania oleifera]|uniref:protein TORNADO 2-like n=1 Tax=Malania oleifera TaxID=397392 RepID=UPI0025AE8B8E|nr:protein TORNADO 2-like [Malania oleifera]